MAVKLGVSADKVYHALAEVYQLMKDGVSDMHCMSEKYLIEDLEKEFQGRAGRTDA